MNTTAEAERILTTPSTRIGEGDRIPTQPLRIERNGEWQQITSDQLFAQRRVVVFGLPGAFTPVCSSQHLPRYNELAPQLRAHGVDEIVCTSVNDPFVLEAWSRDQQCDNVTLLADGNGEFSRSLGMLVDKRDVGYGLRSWRYSMLVDDGVISKLFVEPAGEEDPYGVSSADTMLKHLDPEAKTPDQVAIFTREGCSHCAHAKQMLEDAGYTYVEFPLTDNIRATVVGALAGDHTVPQIFINGELIGGEKALHERLYGAPDSAETRPA